MNTETKLKQDEIIKFTREKSYIFKKYLGRGGCGETVLLYDSIIDGDFVCKKYSPLDDTEESKYYDYFVQEIKVLHLVYHINVVRIFNYYMYPTKRTGYILMEYIKGNVLDGYLRKKPEMLNEVFEQTIEGFTHLQENNILHRDIRPQNIMVTDDGIVKIIDFGFGKKIDALKNFDKSISINWQYEPPKELADGIYNYQTELYFIGSLFKKIIEEINIEHFKYRDILREMLISNLGQRTKTFLEVKGKIANKKFIESDFSYEEKQAYRNFADAIHDIISKIKDSARYFADIEHIQLKLEEIYKNVMLEEYMPKPSSVTSCFINGTYYFNKHSQLEVSILKSFIDLLASSSKDKKGIILNNLHSRLDSIDRETVTISADDDIPF